MKVKLHVFTRYFTEAEEEALFKVMWAEREDILCLRDYWWNKLLRHTAMKPGVLTQLTINDADLALTSFRLFTENDKSDEQLFITLDSESRMAFEELLKINREIRKGELFWPSQEALIITRRGKPMSLRNYQDRLNKWLDKAQIEAGSPSWWRHTWAKRLLKADEHDREHLLLLIEDQLGLMDVKSALVYLQPDRNQGQ